MYGPETTVSAGTVRRVWWLLIGGAMVIDRSMCLLVKFIGRDRVEWKCEERERLCWKWKICKIVLALASSTWF